MRDQYLQEPPNVLHDLHFHDPQLRLLELLVPLLFNELLVRLWKYANAFMFNQIRLHHIYHVALEFHTSYVSVCYFQVTANSFPLDMYLPKTRVRVTGCNLPRMFKSNMGAWIRHEYRCPDQTNFLGLRCLGKTYVGYGLFQTSTQRPAFSCVAHKSQATITVLINVLKHAETSMVDQPITNNLRKQISWLPHMDHSWLPRSLY